MRNEVEKVKKIILVTDNKPIGWALKAAMGKDNSVYSVEVIYDVNRLRNILPSANPSHTFVLFDMKEGNAIHTWLWEVIRIELKSRVPFIAMGFEEEDVFLTKPQNLVFKQRQYEYGYLKKSFSLSKILNLINRMQPVYDVNSHIKRYSRTEGLIERYLHVIENALLNRRVDACVEPFQKIRDLLRHIDLEAEYRERLEFRIERFEKNPKIKSAKSLSRDFQILLEGVVGGRG